MNFVCYWIHLYLKSIPIGQSLVCHIEQLLEQLSNIRLHLSLKRHHNLNDGFRYTLKIEKSWHSLYWSIIPFVSCFSFSCLLCAIYITRRTRKTTATLKSLLSVCWSTQQFLIRTMRVCEACFQGWVSCGWSTSKQRSISFRVPRSLFTDVQWLCCPIYQLSKLIFHIKHYFNCLHLSFIMYHRVNSWAIENSIMYDPAFITVLDARGYGSKNNNKSFQYEGKSEECCKEGV